jgi:hypothetical protein
VAEAVAEQTPEEVITEPERQLLKKPPLTSRNQTKR